MPERGQTWAQHYTEVLLASFKCPLVLPGTNTRMTRQGFKTACLKVQTKHVRGWYDDGKLSNHRTSCRSCEIGQKVKDGKSFKAPKGIKFYSLKALKIESGKYG